MLGTVPEQVLKQEEAGEVAAPAQPAVAVKAEDVEMTNGHTEQHPSSEINTAAIGGDSTMVDFVHPSASTEGATAVEEEAQWEIDSSPYESSSDDSSDDSSSEEDSDDEGYELLDPAEQARILMEDAGSDDEGGKGKGAGGQLRTKNEVVEEVIPKPDVVLTPEMKIEELGSVQTMVEGMVLVNAKTSGEYRVLESGSVLCLEDRSVIGVVSETLGRVEQPLYVVRFTNQESIKEAGLEIGTKIFYSEQHSTYVFTQALKAYKGSDASNLHDEEIGDEEQEFSDDEKEMEHKRRVKQKKLERRGGRTGGDRPRGEHPLKQESYNAATGISYDDEEDGPYKPLARPAGYAQTVVKSEAPEENDRAAGRPREPYGRGRGGDRGRGRGSDRGRGRGGRGGSYQDRDRQQQHNYPPAPPDAPQDPRKQPGYVAPVAQPSAPFNFQTQPGQFPQPPFPFPTQFPAGTFPPPPPFPQYNAQQGWPPAPPQLPAGAFINPAFFGGQQQGQQQWTPPPPPQFAGWTPPPLPQMGGQQGQQVPVQQNQNPDQARAVAEAQEKLRVLRESLGGPR
jgi:H/ACA ribonucleoprotein complex non-core subunit NAF1